MKLDLRRVSTITEKLKIIRGLPTYFIRHCDCDQRTNLTDQEEYQSKKGVFQFKKKIQKTKKALKLVFIYRTTKGFRI